MILGEALDAYLELARGPSTQMLEDNPEIHAAFNAAIHGDRAAWGTLFTHYHPTLMKVAHARAKSAEDAEDAVADVMVKIREGKFSHYKIETPQGVTAVLVRSVINAVKNKNRARKGLPAISIGAEPGEHEPAQPETGGGLPGAKKGKTTSLSPEQKQVVRERLGAIFKDAKLTDKEREFIGKFIGSDEGEVKDIAAPKALSSVAAEVWPEMKDKTRQIHAKRVKERFLKRFCTDKALCDLLPKGHMRDAPTSALRSTLGTFTPACKDVEGSCVEVVEFAVSRCIIEEDGLAADTIYDEVLRWIRASMAP